jgi:hypothetical protein
MDPSFEFDLSAAAPASFDASLDAISAPEGATWLAVRNPRPQPLRWLAAALSARPRLAAAIERLDVSSDSALRLDDEAVAALADFLAELPRLMDLNIESCAIPQNSA